MLRIFKICLFSLSFEYWMLFLNLRFGYCVDKFLLSKVFLFWNMSLSFRFEFNRRPLFDSLSSNNCPDIGSFPIFHTYLEQIWFLWQHCPFLCFGIFSISEGGIFAWGLIFDCIVFYFRTHKSSWISVPAAEPIVCSLSYQSDVMVMASNQNKQVLRGTRTPNQLRFRRYFCLLLFVCYGVDILAYGRRLH